MIPRSTVPQYGGECTFPSMEANCIHSLHLRGDFIYFTIPLFRFSIFLKKRILLNEGSSTQRNMYECGVTKGQEKVCHLSYSPFSCTQTFLKHLLFSHYITLNKKISRFQVVKVFNFVFKAPWFFFC